MEPSWTEAAGPHSGARPWCRRPGDLHAWGSLCCPPEGAPHSAQTDAASGTRLRGTKGCSRPGYSGHSGRLCSPACPRPGTTSPRGRVPLTAKQPCRAVGLPLENPAESGRNQPLNVFFLPCPQRCSQGESYFSKRLERKRPFFLAVWSQFPLLLALGLFSLPSLWSGPGAYGCRPESLHLRLRSPLKPAVEQTCYTGTAGTVFTSCYITSVLEGAGVT